MTAQGIMAVLVGALDRHGIAFMVTGSFASSLFGSPRSTQDLDLVIEATAEQIVSLVGDLSSAGFYVELDSALAALRRESQFNAIDPASGWKVDLIFRKSRPFSLREFERRVVVEFQGHALSVATAEDMVIAKLEWAQRGGSQRQLEDVVSILRVQDSALDRGYVEQWVRELGLEATWRAAQALLAE